MITHGRITKPESMYRLCFVQNGIMYFTSDFENVWGDDWNDAPYEHNADPPYEKRNDEDEDTYIEKIAYCSNDYECKEPSYGCGYNSSFSVEEINKGSIAWLRHDEAGNLMAGATMLEAIKWLKAAGVKWGILHD